MMKQKQSLTEIGKIVDIFNKRLIELLESKGISIYVDKIDVSGRKKDIVNVRYLNDKGETHASINISELMVINFDKFDYHLEINDINETNINIADINNCASECNVMNLFSIYCAYDIIVINSKDYIETFNTVHKPVYPICRTTSSETNEAAILEMIKNGQAYGIDIILYERDRSVTQYPDKIGNAIDTFNDKFD